MKILNIMLITFALLLTSCANNSGYIKKAGAYVTDIKLYDSKDPVNTKHNTEYKNTFMKSELYGVDYEICLSFVGDSKSMNLPLTALFHRADSTMIVRNHYDDEVEENWATSSHYGGWGWDVKGNWEQGQYFIEFYSGDDYLGTREFEVIDDMNLPYLSTIDSYVESIKLFESGAEAPEKGKRFYRTKFRKNDTRYVNWELNLQHMFRDRTDYRFHYFIYDENNEIFGEQVNDSYFEADWQDSTHNGGWGFKNSGNWKQGNYRVELYIDDELIATAPFQIVP